LDNLEEKIAETKHHLGHIIEYAISYFEDLRKKYAQGRGRKSEIRIFDEIEATKVVIRNTKLYVNREEGFVGTSLKKDEYVTDCSDIDDIVVFTKSGQMMVTKVDAKTFIGKNIIHVAVFKKKDKRTTYNIIYKDGKGGPSYIKRFNVTSITRDKFYDLTAEKPNSEILYFSANPNGEAEVVTINLRQSGSIKKLKWDLDFADVLIKGRSAKGNLVTKYPVKRIELKEKGLSTLKPRKIWIDETVMRLNVDDRGKLLGEFTGEDRLLVIGKKGIVKTAIPDMNMHFDDDLIVLEKWNPNKPITIIYYEGEKDLHYVKRFLIENPERLEKVIGEHPKSYIETCFTDYRPVAEVVFAKKRGQERKANLILDLEQFIAVKGIGALGNQVAKEKVLEVKVLPSLPYEEPEAKQLTEIDVIEEESIGNETDGNDNETPGDIDDTGQGSLF
jgi:topoisomerase-4 subunit A